MHKKATLSFRIYSQLILTFSISNFLNFCKAVRELSMLYHCSLGWDQAVYFSWNSNSSLQEFQHRHLLCHCSTNRHWWFLNDLLEIKIQPACPYVWGVCWNKIFKRYDQNERKLVYPIRWYNSLPLSRKCLVPSEFFSQNRRKKVSVNWKPLLGSITISERFIINISWRNLWICRTIWTLSK